MALGTDLRQYTFNLLTLIGKEVDQQFAKWNKPQLGFLAKYVTAHDKAAKSQAETLKEWEEDVRRSIERALFVMELVGIPALSWLGATLESRLGPRIFYTYEDGFAANTGKYFYRKVHDEFQSKIFGDVGKELSGTLLKLAGEAITTEHQPTVDAHRIASSPDFDVFGNNLYSEVDNQNSAAQIQINKMAQAVNNSYTFGDAVVERLRKANPGFDRLPPRRQFELGRQLINGLLQDNRNDWASRWLYYGNDPPQPVWSRIIDQLEQQMWGLWIVQQNLRPESIGLGLFVVKGASGRVFNDTGGFAKLLKESPITARLFDLNAPVMDYKLGRNEPTKDWADQQIQKLKGWAESGDFSYLRNQLRGTPRALQPVDDMWGGSSMTTSAP